MGFSKGNSLLVLDPNNDEVVRKEFDLDRPGRMEESVTILREWIQKQAHFTKKDFSTNFLEKRIIMGKGSLERTKKQLDQVFTIRTLTPQYFAVSNVKEIEHICSVVSIVFMPKATEDFHRVGIIKFSRTDYNLEDILNCMRYTMITTEYVVAHDCVRGYIGIFDVRGLNIIELIKNSNPIELKNLVNLLVGGYGVRVKGLHLLTDSKLVDIIVTFFKSLLSQKISQRVQIHKNVESLHEILLRETLPKDYGGDEKSIEELIKDWINVLSSKEHIEYFEEMSRAGTNENLREDKTDFNNEYAGMPGTFRNLIVD